MGFYRDSNKVVQFYHGAKAVLSYFRNSNLVFQAYKLYVTVTSDDLVLRMSDGKYFRLKST